MAPVLHHPPTESDVVFDVVFDVTFGGEVWSPSDSSDEEGNPPAKRVCSSRLTATRSLPWVTSQLLLFQLRHSLSETLADLSHDFG